MFVGCRSRPAAGDASHAATAAGSPRATEEAWFVDRAAETGLDFQHFNGMSGGFYAAEIFAPGVGFLDYDNDGDLDVYVAQGRMLGGRALAASLLSPPTTPITPGGRLYRNDLQVQPDGSRVLRFTDVGWPTKPAVAGDRPGALEQFEEAVRLSPRFAKGHYSLGVLLASSGRRAEAIAHLAAAVRYDPDDEQARQALGAATRSSGRWQP